MSAPHVPRHHHVTTTARTPGQRWAGWVGLSLLLACGIVFILWLKLAAPGSDYARITELERRVAAIEAGLE